MKCFSWNIRGLNGGVRKSNVQRWIHQNRPMIGGLLETHVKQESLDNLMSTTFPGWRFDSNHRRIVVMWNPRISVVVYLKSEQLMVCGVFDPASRISFTVDSAEHRKTRFTFFSFFETHPEYLKRLSEAWTSPVSRAGPMSTLYLKLRAAKNCCKAINQSRFSNIEKRTREAFEKLQDMQEQ
ncbi:unnamed protein product, partial [Brassica rapa subsp. trilocularis]